MCLEEFQQKSCDTETIPNSITTTMKTFTSSTTSTSMSTITINEEHSNIDIQIDTDQKSCDLDQINNSWICSNGSNHLSHCAKKRQNDAFEYKKCICKLNQCLWTNIQNNELSEFAEPEVDFSGNKNVSSNFLRSLIQTFKLVNKGAIHVNLHLR